jgi:hypothetical protein
MAGGHRGLAFYRPFLLKQSGFVAIFGLKIVKNERFLNQTLYGKRI